VEENKRYSRFDKRELCVDGRKIRHAEILDRIEIIHDFVSITLQKE
jgi:hypothetical protein